MTWGMVTAIAMGVSATATVYNLDAQRRATNQAEDRAKQQQLLADEANNKANAKAPDSAALMAANMANGAMGNSGTMLTGPGGVDNSDLKLGKNSLLGG